MKSVSSALGRCGPVILLLQFGWLAFGAGVEEGLRPLFDGKSLAGWVNVNCAPETWTVRDGLLHCDGVPTGALRTEQPYENFILELEWRHLKPGGNAGVFIWASPLPAQGQPFLRAIEVQVLDHAYGTSDWFTTHGDVFAIHGSTMKPFPPSRGMRSFPTEHRSKGSPEWNHYRVVCTNGVIRLSVNGKEVSGGSDCVWRRGYLGLESEGGIVDWRNIRLQELPPSGASSEQSAPAAEAWRSLYDGRSLRGWQASAAEADGWKVADWTLRWEAPRETHSVLWAGETWGDFELQADWNWAGEVQSKIPPFVLRTVEDSPRDTELPASDLALVKGWNRLRLTRRGTALKISINGQSADPMRVFNGKLRLGLKGAGGPTRFANLFVQ